MYDATNPRNIPASASLVGTYVDGSFKTYPAILSLFPHATPVTITVTGLAGWRVCDCETHDLTPAQAALWALNEVHAGRRPTIYCNISTHNEVIAALADLNLAFVRDVDWWAADWNGVDHLDTASVATQWKSTATLDYSETNGVWPNAPAPVPAPAPSPTPTPVPTSTPSPTEDFDMISAIAAYGQLHTFAIENGAVVHRVYQQGVKAFVDTSFPKKTGADPTQGTTAYFGGSGPNQLDVFVHLVGGGQGHYFYTPTGPWEYEVE